MTRVVWVAVLVLCLADCRRRVPASPVTVVTTGGDSGWVSSIERRVARLEELCR